MIPFRSDPVHARRIGARTVTLLVLLAGHGAGATETVHVEYDYAQPTASPPRIVAAPAGDPVPHQPDAGDGAHASSPTLPARSAMPTRTATLTLTGAGLGIADGATHAVYDSGEIEAPLAFTAVVPHWQATLPAGTALTLQLSTSADGQHWSPYFDVGIDEHSQPVASYPDGRANPWFGDTVGTMFHRSRGDGRHVRLRFTLTRSPAAPSPQVRRLTLSFIDSRLPDVDAVTPGASAPGTGNERGTPDGSSSRTRGNGYPKPPVNARTAWGAAPPSCSYSYCNVTHIAIHHTAGASEYSCDGFGECAADVRAIQALHMDVNGWCDIGYNYLATADGQLWEGRGGGDDVRGAHDGFNCGSMGVASMGYYHPPFDHVWTAEQLDAVAELGAWKADQKGIDPLGNGFYQGYGAVLENVYGHRDVKATACPGDSIYPRLGELRNSMLSKLTGPGASLILDNPDARVLIGDWATGTSSPDKFGADYYFASTGGGAFCVWAVQLPAADDYVIDFWWPEGSNRSPSTRLLVKQSGPAQWFTVDQRSDGGQWNPIGQLSLAPGRLLLGVSNAGTPGSVVMCDAVRLTPRAR